MQVLTLKEAMKIINGAMAEGKRLKLKPLTVAVLDPGGHLIALQREVGSANLRPQIAIAKANGALGLGVSTRTLAQISHERPNFVAALSMLAPSGLVPAAGGVLICDTEQRCIGAVGVTGDSSDNDEACALAGLAAAELLAQNESS